jgi:hypothetical protein
MLPVLSLNPWSLAQPVKSPCRVLLRCRRAAETFWLFGLYVHSCWCSVLKLLSMHAVPKLSDGCAGPNAILLECTSHKAIVCGVSVAACPRSPRLSGVALKTSAARLAPLQ